MVSTRNHHFLFHSQSQPASLSNTLSLRTQGLGLCPLRDPVLSQPMTQIHSTAGLGQRGSGWQCLEKARAGGMCLGYGCKYVRILEAKHPSPRAGKPHRGQSPGRSAGSYSQPPVVQRGKPRPRPRKEGTCPESSNWLVAEPPARGAGTLGFQSQLCSISASYSTFIETEDKELGVCENSNISRTQGLATGSTSCVVIINISHSVS